MKVGDLIKHKDYIAVSIFTVIWICLPWVCLLAALAYPAEASVSNHTNEYTNEYISEWIGLLVPLCWLTTLGGLGVWFEAYPREMRFHDRAPSKWVIFEGTLMPILYPLQYMLFFKLPLLLLFVVCYLWRLIEGVM